VKSLVLALLLALGLALGLVLGLAPAQAASPLKLVAAENFYGGVAQQIGGAGVEVISVMSNPDQDPHLFETSPAVLRQLAAAQLVIYNGADYDPWMPKLLRATPQPDRAEIVAADLVHRTSGDNPHLWYDPATMPAVARAIVAALGKADPAHAADYQARLAAFLSSLKPIDAKVEAIRKKFGGAPVTASEPAFGVTPRDTVRRLIGATALTPTRTFGRLRRTAPGQRARASSTPRFLRSCAARGHTTTRVLWRGSAGHRGRWTRTSAPGRVPTSGTIRCDI